MIYPAGDATSLPPTERPVEYSPGEQIRRGLDHFEMYVRESNVDFKSDEDLRRGSIGALRQFRFDLENKPVFEDQRERYVEQRRECDELRAQAQRMIVTVLDDKARRKVNDDTIKFLHDFEQAGPISKHEMYTLNLRMLTQFAYLPPNLYPTLDSMTVTIDNRIDPDDPLYVDFLEKAQQLPNASLQKRAAQLLAGCKPGRQKLATANLNQQKLATANLNQPRAVGKKPDAVAGPPHPASDAFQDDVRFTRLDLKSDGSLEDSALLPMLGWLPVGKGIDFAWNDRGMFVMKKRGILHLIDERAPKAAQEDGEVQPAFDGKYVWITKPRMIDVGLELVAVDPLTEDVRVIDDDDGLKIGKWLQVAPISAGKALIVGNFGQAYAAIVDLPPGAKSDAKITIIHEFRKVAVVGDHGQWRDPDLIFEPAQVRTLEFDSKAGAYRTAAIWRRSTEPSLAEHPLLLDLKTGGAKVVEQECDGRRPDLIVALPDCLCLLGVNRKERKSVIWRIASSAVTSRPAATGMPYRELLAYDGALHAIGWAGSGWAVAPLERGEFRRLKLQTPHSADGITVQRSENYGLVGFVNEHGRDNFARDDNVYKIEFARPVQTLIGGSLKNNHSSSP